MAPGPDTFPALPAGTPMQAGGLRYSRPNGLVQTCVVGSGREQINWIVRDMGRVLPEAWDRFRAMVPDDLEDLDLVEAYARMLADGDPEVRASAAKAWCDWEDAHVSLGAGHDPRYDDPRFRYRFARLVTHYWRHQHFLEADELLRRVDRLHGIPAALIQGRLDISGPPDVAWHLARDWSTCELIVCEDGSHGLGSPSMTDAVVGSLNRFAQLPRRHANR